jgi:hypothetical protein
MEGAFPEYRCSVPEGSLLAFPMYRLAVPGVSMSVPGVSMIDGRVGNERSD